MNPTNGSRRRPSAPRDEVQRGLVESRTLGEITALDHAVLLAHAIPEASGELAAEVRAAGELGILARMRAIGAALHAHLGAAACTELTRHPSDTVRGWAWFALATEPGSPPEIVALILPAADDPHFGVREWAWMAVRDRLAAELDESVAALAELTTDPSERVRRFASEALRPRGVWAKRIAVLGSEPDRGLPILEPLRADPSTYVQDSVANWINDAAKSNPGWARDLAIRWARESPGPETRRILRRGLRSLDGARA
ncbi:DNA alkylation repair protein [Leucobacter sp. OLJS4]|uniref:HEAT repeat domain-containing protein n=1 Tax=unclassified Leucobacter TaxID=2621730 RepID=UPI000C636B66|nr:MULTISPECIES: HEAT repeat domain-containing protein [unclassified Leucobacter]PII83788.1 DNA alkylation repair protein [Leucobacter sp. OLCALW19]PII89321.1 DNA alkylation repair protein [Leucobacter sp. OLTLW20]PII90682.1 DNA alkylation repair protein [Leucobacter sp. OLAS13]PII99603.1 DNA alkylation repair protein [Leucobacter sp. OLDS2]PIJ01740.1 DNA alkylation repair protein [Leucobacter sp. OLCS4]